MLCPSCGTAFEGRFCPNCGTEAQPFAFLCLRCGAAFNGFACPYCGTPLGGPAQGSGVRAVGSVIWSLGILAFLLLIAIDLVAFLFASWMIVDGALVAGPRLIPLYVLFPYPIGETFDVSAAVFLGYFGLIAAGILSAYVWYGWRDAKPTAEAFARPLDQLLLRLESRSAWVATGQVFLATMFFQIVYILLLLATGFVPEAPTSSLPVPPWYPYFALANASVYEEFVTRWMFIGIPLFLAALARESGVPSGQAFSKAARHLVGGGLNRDSPRSLVRFAAVLIVLSSIVFGLAHVPYWGPWKFLPAMVAGLGMGYLFVRRGLLAAILLHFATDYFAAATLMSGSDLGAQLLLGLFLLVLAGLGGFFFIWYMVYSARLLNYFADAWRGRSPTPTAATVLPGPLAPPPPRTGFATMGPVPAPPLVAGEERLPPPPPPGYGPPSFRCGRCGWPEARYDAGRFTCLRCGQVH